MNLNRLAELKINYQKKVEYYKILSFDNLASDFQDVVNLIHEIEEFVKDAATQIQEEVVQTKEEEPAAALEGEEAE